MIRREPVSVRPFGDRAFLIELEQRRDPAQIARSRAIADAWEARGLGAAVPAYASAVVRFDPARTTGSGCTPRRGDHRGRDRRTSG